MKNHAMKISRRLVIVHPEKRTNSWFVLLTLFCGIGCFYFFKHCYPYHLQHREQMLLFTYSWEQLSSYWNQPAALACLMGDFCTQFLHLKWMGPLLITLVLVNLQVISFWILRKWTNRWVSMGFSLLIFLWEGLRFCDIRYPLSSTLSLLGGCLIFVWIRSLKNRWPFIIGSFIGLLCSYYFFGYGMFFVAGFIAIEALWRKSPSCLLISLLAIAIPGISANYFRMLPKKAYTYPATVWMGNPNFSNERILGLSTALYHEDWIKVNELAFKGNPSNDISVCYNLANAVQGKLPERLMNFFQPGGLALFMPIYEQSTYLSTQLAGEVWYQLGDMTMAEHASILSMIFSPDNKNSRMVKRLAEINLINGETEAAMKYLHILSKTLFYSDWAKERMPGKESNSVKMWLKNKQKNVPLMDTLRLSCTDVGSSLHTLLKSNANNTMALDYLLCFDLLMKDLDHFIADYQQYYKGKPNRLYAEALMIQLYKKHATAKEVKATGIHPSVIKDFNLYNRVHGQSQGNPSVLRNQFGRTYWFYYQFAKFD